MKSIGMVLVLACASLAGIQGTATEDETAAEQSDQARIDEILDALYAAVTFPPGSEPDWDALREMLLEEAVLAQPAPEPAGVQIVSVDGFFELFRRDLDKYEMRKQGFNETIAARRTEVYGHVAHSFVVFEPRLGESREGPTRPGLDSIELVKRDGKWKIASITTQFELPGEPLPESVIPAARGGTIR